LIHVNVRTPPSRGQGVLSSKGNPRSASASYVWGEPAIAPDHGLSDFSSNPLARAAVPPLLKTPRIILGREVMPTMTRRVLIVLVILLLVPLALLAAAVLVVQSEHAERWVEARIGDALEREVEIEGVDLQLGWPLGVNVQHLRITNPSWAMTPDLIDATGLHARVEISPLFRRRLDSTPW
jgi:hypothetical protein